MTKYNTLLRKVNQTGSMMIEALAMLTLISLVTPTLYKKSAERTTELQDINTATQIRTLAKAVDNYTLANYQELLKDLEKQETGQLTLTADNLKGYLPYGYDLDKATKNFDKPILVVKRQGEADSLTSFVILPKIGDVNDYRASQIASMVGANGGYITEDGGKKVAKGVGGVWGLNNDDLTDMLGDGNIPDKGTLVAASSENINEASRAQFENTKYLQRTPAEHEEWRNTMMTDLYMGGVESLLQADGTIPFSKILGVDQLIIGDIQTGGDANESNADLVVKSHLKSEGGETTSGAAFIEGSLHALQNMFSVFTNDANNPELNFAGNLLKATKDHFSINATESDKDDLVIERAADGSTSATINVATTIDNDLTSVGDTALATDIDSTFKVGPDGDVINADKYNIDLQRGNLVINNGLLNDEPSNVLIATDTVDIKGATKISDVSPDDEVQPARSDLDLKLNVQGDAFVSKTLEAGEVDAHKFDTMRLYAGGTNYEKANEDDDHYIRWLNVDEDGVVVRDINGNRPERMRIDENEASIYGPYAKDELGSVIGRGSMSIGATDAHFEGVDSTVVKTTAPTGEVSIQHNAIIAKNHAHSADGNTVDVHATQMRVYGNDGKNLAFEVQSGETNDRTKSHVGADVDQFVVQKNGKKLLNIVSGENETTLREDSVVEIDPEKFRVWANSLGDDVNNRIFEVNAGSGEINDDGKMSNAASVYVRRGAIELEGSGASNKAYAADEGVGYIEASRFVANNLQADGSTIVEPRYATASNFDSGALYDRYMVNPAYTSVMHDIKLTTRGGARLSDILPDFINKGIYIVNNTYKDGINFNNLTVSNNSGVISANGVSEVDEGDTFSGQWASPFMGMVPAPQCPPGHARVITITPASFQMAQTGDMILNSDGRYYVSEEVRVNKLENYTLTQADERGDQMVAAPLEQDVIIQKGRPDGTNENMHLYYLGMAPDTHVSDGHEATYKKDNTPKPLYFQQSTWLKSKVIAYSTGPCTGSQASNGGCDNFMGWATVMGFIYPYRLYQPIIDTLVRGSVNNEVAKTEDSLVGINNENKVYWNIFPVRPRSMEAYATVYCYFDRTNIFGSGNNPTYVDQYDQLNNFRAINKKKDVGTTNSGTHGTNKEYIDRLNDPHLKYDDPW